MSAFTLTRSRTLVAVLAAAALIAVGMLLLGIFDDEHTTSTGDAPTVVIAPTSGGIEQANSQRLERQLQHGVAAAAVTSVGDTKGDLPASRLGHGAAGYGPAGDTKNDVHPGTPAVGQELAYQAGTAAGAGH